MRYGVLGGSFDPIHLGHVALADAAMDQLGLDEVIFVPNAKNPLKKAQSFCTPQERLDMCRIALKDKPKFTVSDIEITRGGRSFTIETIEELSQAQNGQIWFIIGADALKDLKNWKSPDKLIRLCRLAAVTRPPEDLSRALSILGEPYDEAVDEIVMTAKRISSSAIRDDIRRDLSPEMWLHPGVWEYIQNHGLYQE